MRTALEPRLTVGPFPSPVGEKSSSPEIVEGTANFYRAMSLFQEGKAEGARVLFTATEAKMKTLPADDQNPLA